MAALALAVAAGCGDAEGDRGGALTVPPPASVPVGADGPEDRAAAARAVARWNSRSAARLDPAVARLERASRGGDRAALADALRGYAREARRSREELVRLRLPLQAWDPAAEAANALADGARLADDLLLGLERGATAPPGRLAHLRRAAASHRAAAARLEARTRAAAPR